MNWRKLEDEIVYFLRKQGVSLRRLYLTDIMAFSGQLNVTELAKTLAQSVDRVEFKPKPVVLQQDENAGIP